jgi:hypothetical protein
MKHSIGGTRLDRRSFLTRSALAASITMATPLDALLARGRSQSSAQGAWPEP